MVLKPINALIFDDYEKNNVKSITKAKMIVDENEVENTNKNIIKINLFFSLRLNNFKIFNI